MRLCLTGMNNDITEGKVSIKHLKVKRKFSLEQCLNKIWDLKITPNMCAKMTI